MKDNGPAPHHRFLTLDALRGIAALAVIIRHTSRFFGGIIFTHGYLAVDFFFMLSGFVLTYAYQSKLNSGWSTSSFLRVRLARLYPLYLVGIVLGFIFDLLQSHYGKVQMGFVHGLLIFLLGLFFLPAVFTQPGGLNGLFPFDTPTWSLFYELIANLVHAFFLRRRPSQILAVVIALAAVLLVVLVCPLQTINVGFSTAELGVGLVRVIFSYVMGMFLFFLWSTKRYSIKFPPLLSAIVLMALLGCPTPPNWFAIYDLVTVLVFFPFVLFLSTSTEPPHAFHKSAEVLGLASYALYVLHVPVAEFFAQAWGKARHHKIELDAPWGGIVYIVLILVISLLLDRFYDIQARKYLRDKLFNLPKELKQPRSLNQQAIKQD